MTSISSDVCETKERRDVSSQMAAAAAGRRIIHFSERGDRHGRKNNQTTKHLTLCVLFQVNPPTPPTSLPPHEQNQIFDMFADTMVMLVGIQTPPRKPDLCAGSLCV